MPTGPALNRDRILDAAIALGDREGIAALSMRRLGAELGVQAMSLYNHVENKEALLAGIAARLLARMTVTVTEDAPWQDVLRQVLHAYRALAIEHPNLFPLVLDRPFAAPEALPPLETTLRALEQTGLDAGTIQDLFLVGSSFVEGFALDEARRQRVPDPWFPAPDAIDVTFPVARRILRAASMDPDRAFERGISMLIAGIESMIEEDLP